MSFSKVIPGKYDNLDALDKCINYCVGETVDYEKCEYWNGYGVLTTSIPAAINSMKAVRRLNYEMDGKQLAHVVITIKRYIKDKSKVAHKANEKYEDSACDDVGEEVAYMLCQRGFQTIYSKHIDKDYLHVHFVVNTVNFMNGSVLTNLNKLKALIDSYVSVNFPLLQWRVSY